MPDVPAEAVLDLYAHLSFDWVSSFPPSIGDFRKAWRTWDYWAEQNRVSEDLAPIAGIAALMPAPSSGDGPFLRACRLQHQVFHLTGNFVCCDCLPRYGDGNGNTAVFSRDETRWVCAKKHCNFSRVIETPAISSAVASEREVRERPIVTRKRAELLALDFEIELKTMGAEDWLCLFQLLGWLDKQYPARETNRETYSQLWNEFAASQKGSADL